MYNLVLCHSSIIFKELEKLCDFTKDCVIYPKDCKHKFNRKGELCDYEGCKNCGKFIDLFPGKTVLAEGVSVYNAAKAMRYTEFSIDYDKGVVSEIRDYHILPGFVSYSIKPTPKSSCIQCNSVSYKDNNIAHCSKLDKDTPLSEVLSKVMEGCPEPNIIDKQEI